MRTVAETAKAYVPPDAPPVPLRTAPFPPEAVAVNIALLRATHFANYIYQRGAREVTTCLRLVSPPERGYQQLLAEELRAAPTPHSTPRFTDEWGNAVIEIHQERVQAHQTLVVASLMETVCAYGEDGLPVPTPVPTGSHAARPVNDYLPFTNLTTPDDRLIQSARDVATETADLAPLPRLKAFSDFVHRQMHFQSGTTGVGTSAAEAWENKRGVCQDYTHILITLCRLNNIPARYVSGCVPGEGVMHAWTEACLPHPTVPDLLCWWPVDATYNKWVSERYISIAAGRDYRDIAPTYGSYFGGSNTLKHRSQIVLEQKSLYLLPR
ncbi:MAG: transglutaminase family protein [Fibrella sp.]|nr:transglutaminase family protein [Armatimonadota bacterium]